MTHKNVIELIRKYTEHLMEFGPLAFETRVMRADGRGGEMGEVAFLNEPQSTLLVTFMRNSPNVINFKVALVKAFYELRGRITQQTMAQVQYTAMSDRMLNSMINRKAFDMAHRLAPSIKRYVREKIDSAREEARYRGEPGIATKRFIDDVLDECFEEELIRDLMENI